MGIVVALKLFFFLREDTLSYSHPYLNHELNLNSEDLTDKKARKYRSKIK